MDDENIREKGNFEIFSKYKHSLKENFSQEMHFLLKKKNFLKKRKTKSVSILKTDSNSVYGKSDNSNKRQGRLILLMILFTTKQTFNVCCNYKQIVELFERFIAAKTEMPFQLISEVVSNDPGILKATNSNKNTRYLQKSQSFA